MLAKFDAQEVWRRIAAGESLLFYGRAGDLSPAHRGMGGVRSAARAIGKAVAGCGL
jgi:hypothetical protein